MAKQILSRNQSCVSEWTRFGSADHHLRSSGEQSGIHFRPFPGYGAEWYGVKRVFQTWRTCFRVAVYRVKEDGRGAAKVGSVHLLV